MLTLSVGHVVCLLALVGGVSSCSNPGVVTLNDKTRYSDVIVTGSIESKVGDGKYSLTVDCVLKDSGADIPGALNISGVETEEGGMCFVSEISEGKKWVLFLSSFYSMRYKEEPYDDYSRIVQTGCDLHVKSTLPLGGVSKNCEDVVTRACPTQPPIVHTKRTKRPRITTTTTTVTSRSVGQGMGSGGRRSVQTPRPGGMGTRNKSSLHLQSSVLILLNVFLFVHFRT